MEYLGSVARARFYPSTFYASIQVLISEARDGNSVFECALPDIRKPHGLRRRVSGSHAIPMKCTVKDKQLMSFDKPISLIKNEILPPPCH
jgi:hypothetical protein